VGPDLGSKLFAEVVSTNIETSEMGQFDREEQNPKSVICYYYDLIEFNRSVLIYRHFLLYYICITLTFDLILSSEGQVFILS